jgi:hypothetical protein
VIALAVIAVLLAAARAGEAADLAVGNQDAGFSVAGDGDDVTGL